MRRDWGAARNGLADWLGQRVSAAVLLVLLPWPVALLAGVYMGRLDQLALLRLLDAPASRVVQTLLVVAVLVHAFIGLKVIAEDYVHAIGLRIVLVNLMRIGMFALGVWWLAVIWAWAG